MLHNFHGAKAPSQSSIEYLLAYLVHNKDVLIAANSKLLPAHFKYDSERIYAVFVDVLFKYFRENNEIPARAVLECDAVSRIQSNPSFNEVDVRNICDLVEWIFTGVNPEELRKNTDHGLNLLKVFLLDRIRKDLQQTTSDINALEVNEELPRIVVDLEKKLSEVNSVTELPDGVITPERWIEPDREPFLTGIPFIDSFTITYPGDVNVILGPTGIGKTTLALQILAATAKRDYYTNNENHGWVAYFGYEDLSSAASKRVISYVAKIKRERLEMIRSLDDLSTRHNLQPYELEYYRQNPYADRKGERERYEAVEKFVKESIKVYNCSGVRIKDEKPLGNGGLEEVRYILENTQNRIQKPLRLVVIDWAGMLVRRYLQSKGKFSDKNIILELESFIDRVYQEISLPLSCVVFVVHQLRGQVSKQSPTTPVSHADAAWCSNFAVNAWNVICFGPKDPETNACTLSWTKTRRGVGKRNLICRIDENFSQLIDDDSYYLDQITKRIVRKSGDLYGQAKTGQINPRSVIEAEERF